MKRIIFNIFIATAICVATSCTTKSDYDIEKAEFAAEQAELAKERQEIAKEYAELRKEYEELRKEYLRERKEYQRTVRKERHYSPRSYRRLKTSEIDTLSRRVRNSALWPTSGPE